MAVKKTEKKQTNYVVLRGDTVDGPFEVVGPFTANGQIAAKRAATASLINVTEGDEEAAHDVEKSFFIAVPASSFVPQKPTVEIVITFANAEGEPADEDAADDDDDADADDGDDADAEPGPGPEPIISKEEAEAAAAAAAAAGTDDDGFPPDDEL